MNQNQNFEKLKVFLNQHINQCNNGYVNVFPIRCGIGKSTYVKHLISDVIRSGDHGLIIVTDSIIRMGKYVADKFFQDNIDKIAVLTNENFAQEIRHQWHKPILIMSTQRYFNLTKEEIVSFTKYSGGQRAKIVIDEKPYLFTQKHIGIKILDDIDAALNEAIDDHTDAKEKEWITQQWATLIKRVKDTIKTYEEMDSTQIELWHEFEPKVVTEDDDRFFSFVNKYHNKLNQYQNDTCSNIYAVKQLFNYGATFIGSKIASGEYRNYFIVTVDNSDLLLDLGVDVYVLDGTADIDPDYNGYYIKMIDCSQFNVPLNNLVINFVDLPTSKNNIVKSGSHAKAIISSIKNYIKTSPDSFDAIFTYAAIEDQFTFQDPNHMKKIKTEHFGNLRGFNDFQDCTNIAQIGWNRYPDSAYRQIDYITSLAEYDYKHKTVVRLTGKDTYTPVMYKALLTDFEQNLFRSKIRNVDCDEVVNYTVFCNTKLYRDLIDMIRDRYGKLGATINELPTPKDYEISKTLERKTSAKSNVQTVLEWYRRQPGGKIVKASEIYEACNLTREQFKTVKKSPIIKKILNDMKTDVSGIYKIPDKL